MGKGLGFKVIRIRELQINGVGVFDASGSDICEKCQTKIVLGKACITHKARSLKRYVSRENQGIRKWMS